MTGTGDNRRQAHRFLLKIGGEENTCTANLAEAVVECDLLDLSTGGLRGSIIVADGATPVVEKGLRVQLLSPSSETFEFLAGRSGVVAWTTPDGREFGITLDETIPGELVESAMFHFTSILSP
ncbi:hypothetical protein GGQ74_000666 [Desulfobaculum xiamenense]|uniref:PilZ domain-containing protein n=1 Tax=Desulfobaculum xiamenense TaxID=995050 RepID=A0A846QE67_9BACT|nr:PilZ domain-containing protein [Desulfobaculum xiamenense]NJB67026.1 hypothetical protein [Desulfobaculum xiamenense]